MPSIPVFHLRRRSLTKDYRIIQGATNSWTWSFPDYWGVDWSGFAARCQFRRRQRLYAPTVIAAGTATIIDPGPTQRLISVLLTPEQSAAFRDLTGTMDIEIYNGTVVHRVGEFPWVLSLETTE